jgi:hypothetical protein
MNGYDCGIASLQMVFNYWFPQLNADQHYLSNIARTSQEVGTAATDMIRAGHFSVLSSTAGYAWPNYTLQNGLPGKPLGFASFGYDQTFWLDDLKECLASNIPVIVLMLYDNLPSDGGHYRVAVGYDDVNQTITLHDPWGRNNQPHNITYTYDEFTYLWNYTQNPVKFGDPKGPFFGLILSPFEINTQISQPTMSKENGTESVMIFATATYPIMPPFDQDPNNLAYVASNVIMSLQITNTTNSAIVDTYSQSTNLGSLQPGASTKAAWEVTCVPSCSGFEAVVEVRGIVSGSVPFAVLQKKELYPPYQYVDVIGAQSVISL